MQPRFPTTRWTLVVRASSFDQAERKEALSSLMSQNWYPLYCFVRRSGKSHQEAEDLIQGFFLHVIEKDVIAGVAPHRKSRFRSFLLACLKNFIANDLARQRAAKRGGGHSCVSLDFTRADQKFQREPEHTATAERAFDRAWAIELIGNSLERLAETWAAAGRLAEFEMLKPCLLGAETLPRQEVANRLGISPDILKVKVHRLRSEFRQGLCRQVAETLENQDLLEDEINFLFSSIST